MPADPAVPPPVASAPVDDDTLWPLYFAREALNAPNVQLQVGDQFEHQNKPAIAGLGESYGVERADRRPFHTLKYVGVLMLPRRLHGEIRQKRLNYAEAVERLERWRAAQGT